MTGIERLRKIAHNYRNLSKNQRYLGINVLREADLLADIADQIERELTCDEDTIENVRLIVGGVVDDMERHVSGVEGMEDSPVARWARELREALGGEGHDHADEREIIAWVRDHGGLERVKKLLDWVVGHCSTRQQLDFDFWLSGRVMHELGFEEDMADRDEVERRLLARLMPEGCDWEFLKLHMSNLRGFMLDVMDRLGVDKSDSDAPEIAFDVLDRRLMPEGMSWPVFEDGEPVRIGDVVSDVEVRSVVFRDGGILLSDCTSVPGWGTWRSYKEPIKRPSKVLDADGVDTSVGDTVYDVDTGEKMWVCALPEQGAYQCVKLRLINGMFKTLDPCRLTHRAPVIAADGRPLREGETVWDTNGDELIIGAFEDGGHTVTCRYADVGDAIPVHGMWSPSDLTHERPDSWERLEEDAEKAPCDYFGCDANGCHGCPAYGWNVARGGSGCGNAKMRDLVRRAKKLAERERGE